MTKESSCGHGNAIMQALVSSIIAIIGRRTMVLYILARMLCLITLGGSWNPGCHATTCLRRLIPPQCRVACYAVQEVSPLSELR